jgi:ferredoxin
LVVQNHFDSDGGFVAADDIAGFAGDSLDADFYICGPAPFMDLVETTLLQLSVEPARIFIERFTVDDGPGPQPTGAELAPADVTLILKGKPKTVAYQAGDTILETARRAGLQPPFSCEAGNCATCMAFLHEGSVTMRFNNALTPEEVEEGWILTCQSVPTSQALKVEYESL